MGFKRGAIVIPMLLAVATTGVLAATQPAQKKPEAPVFGVGVTLVAVPVFVTDKNGKSVQGLTADDFVIEDDGKPVPIAAFQAIDVDAPAFAPGADGTPERASLPVAVQAAAPRQFMILIDVQFSPRSGLTFGQKAASAYVRDKLAPGDLVAVATTGPAGLRILTNFTTDHEYVARVISGTSTAGTPSADPLGFSSTGISGGVGSMIADPMGPGGLVAASGGGGGKNADAELAALDALMGEASRREYRNEALAFLSDLEKLVQLVSPLQGRKQIVLFSGGFAESAWVDPTEGQPLRAKMEAIYRDASRTDVVIHTVDLVGIEEAVDLTSQTGPNGTLDTAGVGISGPRSASGALHQQKSRATLIAMSENTGGRATRPTGDLGRAFGEVDQISRHSYVIAFETSDADVKGDHFRKLKVRVKRPGLSVSHRREYSAAAPTAAASGSVQILAAEAISKGLSGGRLHLQLQALPYHDHEGKPTVHAVLHVDGSALAEAAQGKAVALQVYGYAMSGGRVVDGLALNTSLDLTKFGPALRNSGITVLTAFPASHGNVDLRFFVRAGSTDLSGSIQRNVAVPAFSPGERVVSTPMFILSPEGRLVVPFQPSSRPAIPIPFYVGDLRFVPDSAVSFATGEARDACVFVSWDRAPDSAPLQVTGELFQVGQEPRPLVIEGPPRVASAPDGFDRYLVRVVPPRVAPGAYRLRLSFSEPGTGRTVRTETDVEIGGQ